MPIAQTRNATRPIINILCEVIPYVFLGGASFFSFLLLFYNTKNKQILKRLQIRQHELYGLTSHELARPEAPEGHMSHSYRDVETTQGEPTQTKKYY